jgi:hypothetical protein
LIEAADQIGIMFRLFLVSFRLIGSFGPDVCDHSILLAYFPRERIPFSPNSWIKVGSRCTSNKKREDDHNPPTILKYHSSPPTHAEHLILPHRHGTDLDHFSLSGFQSREDIPCWSSSIAVYLVVEPLSGVELQELA